MKNILITGASGYLGSRLIKELIKKYINCKIVCIVRKNTNVYNLKKLSENIIFLNTDDSEYTEKLKCINVDIAIHTACNYVKSNISDVMIFESNFLLPFNILTLSSIKKHIFIGTSLPKYLNAYTISKKNLSDWGRYYSEKHSIDFFNVLLENFYGQDEPENRFIPSVIKKLKNNEDVDLTQGTQKRDFIYIDDVINGLIIILESNLSGYHKIPLGSGEWVTIKELLEYLKKTSNSNSKLNFGAIPKRKNEPNCIADLTIMNSLGLKVKYNWKEGMKKIIKGT